MTTFDLKDMEQFDQFIGETKKKIEITNKKGDVAVMELEPLEAKYFGKIMYIESNFPKPKVLNPVEVKAGRPPIYESQEQMQKRLKEEDYKTYSDLFDLLMKWIKQSYPNLEDSKLRKFVFLNMMTLTEAFMEQHTDMPDPEEKESKNIKEFIKSKQVNEETIQTGDKPSE